MRVAAMTAMLVLTLGAAPARADETVVPPTAFEVEGGSVTSPALEAGAEYRLEAGLTFQEVGPNVTFVHDAAYCFDDDNPEPICKGDPSLSNTGLWAGYVGSDTRPFWELEGTAPAYTDTHHYYTRFIATQDAPLRLVANIPSLEREYPGQLAVALYKVSGVCRRSVRQCNSPQAFFPLDEEPRPGQKVFYPLPESDFPVLARGPDINKRVKRISVKVDADTKSLNIYSVLGDEDSIVSAFYICHTFMPSRGLAVLFGSLTQVLNCTAAVSAVLARCKRLKQDRGGPGLCGGPTARHAHSAATGGCHTRAIDPVKGGRKSKIKLRCTQTATGIKLTLKPKRKRHTLRKLLGKHPDLAIGTMYDGDADKAVAVTWHFKR